MRSRRGGASRLSSGWELAGSQGQPQTLEPATHGGVDEQVADSEHDAADDGRVDRAADGDRLAGGRLEALPQALRLDVVDRHGRRQGHRELVLLAAVALAEGLGRVAQEIEPAVFDE